ncbi:MAG TPA: tetratricopeptide repeat protein [Candidatus Limnocylindrales bacterium]|nr:tetratricopeptide repeat protein [Candidatus Limnocylindrales bacterium]
MVQEVAFRPAAAGTPLSETFASLMALGEEADTTTRQRRQLGEAAIAHATRGEWEEAVVANRQLLELGPDIDACNRLGKALAELGRHAEALKAYEQALERDATNRIAQRNIERLRVLMAAKRPASNGKGRPEKAPVTLFIEEMGKTGRARLINMAAPRVLAPLSPGDAITLDAQGDELVASVGKTAIGSVEPRIATRLLKLIASGNRYDAAITTVHEAGGEVVIMIREVFTHPDNFGKVSFPTQGQAAVGVRPYMKGTALRYDDDDEVEEADEDSEEVEELDTTLPEYSGEPELEEELVEEP